MFGTSEQEGVRADVTGEGFSTTTVDNGMHWFELRILPLPLRRSYINRQRGNSSVDLNPIVCGSFLHCFVSFSGTDNRLIRSSKKAVRSSYCNPLHTAKKVRPRHTSQPKAASLAKLFQKRRGITIPTNNQTRCHQQK